MKAYFVGHLGLGDNLYNIGAVQFLSEYYEKVFFLCKNKYRDNLNLIFSENNKIDCLPLITESDVSFDEEIEKVREVLQDKYNDNECDVFISGFANKPHHAEKITNPAFLSCSIPNNPSYNLNCDMITDDHYWFIKDMYSHAKLTLAVMFDYWKMPFTPESQEMYQSVKHYRIVFLQTRTSNDKELNILKLKDKYIHDKGTILISNDENLYATYDNPNEDIQTKRRLCEQFVGNKLVHYMDTLMNSNEIYIIDSCFVGLVLPLYKKGMLKANPLRIIIRKIAHTIEL